MLMITFICLLAVCVIAGVACTLVKYKFGAVNVAIKLFAPFSCAMLAVVTANLSSAIGGYSMFIILGLLFMVVAEGVKFTEKTTAHHYITNIFCGLGFACFMAGALLHGTFNLLSLGFGLFAALGIFLVGLALQDKEKNLHFWISNAIYLLLLGLFLGQSVALLHQMTHLIAGVLYLASAALIAASKMCKLFAKEQTNFIQSVSAALNILGLIAIASSIYFI